MINSKNIIEKIKDEKKFLENNYNEYLNEVFCLIRELIKEKNIIIGDLTGINNISEKFNNDDIIIIYAILTKMIKFKKSKSCTTFNTIYDIFNNKLCMLSDETIIITALILLDFKYIFDENNSILKFYINVKKYED